jgi:capsular exopolysaccharide synthesis family protein
LLDCDLHQHLPTPVAPAETGEPGLSDVLRTKAELSDVIVKDPFFKHYVIPAGSMARNPADWLVSQRMGDIIDQLRNAFDYIVIDAPPLLPVMDALALSALVDKIVLVVACGETPRTSASEAIRILRPEAHRIAGIVLNKVDPDQIPQYGYGRYRYNAASSA